MSNLLQDTQLQLLLPDGRIETIELDSAPERFVIGPNQRCHVVTEQPFDLMTPFLGIEKQSSHINVFPLPAGQNQAEQEPPPTQLFPNDAINIGATTLMFVLLEQAKSLSGPVKPVTTSPVEAGKKHSPDELARALSFDSRPPDKPSPLCKLELSQRIKVGSVDNRSDFELMVTNTSSWSETMEFGVIGLPAEWVDVLPKSGLLRPGESLFVQVRVCPDRTSTRLAGDHHFVIGASSTRAEGPKVELGATFELEAFTSYSLGTPTLETLDIGWRKKQAKTQIPLRNLGNKNQVFRVETQVDDKNNQCHLQLKGEKQKYAGQTEFSVKPGEQKFVNVYVKPLRRRWLQWNTPQSLLTIKAQAIGGDQGLSSTSIAVTARPLFGKLGILLCASLIAFAGLFGIQPRISDFDADKTVIVAGDTIVLSWVASPFSRLRLEPESRDLFGSSGSARLQPDHDTRYLLIAENFLSDIAPGFFGDQEQVTVYVDGNLPSIKFFSDVDTVVAGQPVNLWWEIGDATRLTLDINGVVEELSAAEHVSTRLESPTQTSTYILRAYNRHTNEDGVVASKTIVVLGDGARPVVGEQDAPAIASSQPSASNSGLVAEPVIESFTVSPSSITAGQRVELNWNVSGVDQVTIRPVGQLAAEGSLIQIPQQSTSYILTAVNGNKEVQLVRQVIVRPKVADNPPPSVSASDADDTEDEGDETEDEKEAEVETTEEPCSDPLILTFEADPQTFVTSNRPEEVTFTWDIEGTTTDVELRGPIVGKIDGFANQDSWTQFLDTSTNVTLIATDRECRASKTLQVVQDTPTPQIASLSEVKTFVSDRPLTITVYGEGFSPESVVRVNNAVRPTVYLDPNTVTVELSVADVSAVTSHNINVYSPGAATTLSNTLQLAVENPVPSISSINPTELLMKPTAVPTEVPTVTPVPTGTVTPVPTATIAPTPEGLLENDIVRIRIVGTGFLPVSVVRVSDHDFASEYISSTELILAIELDSLLDIPTEAYLIDVWNPEPGGGASNKIELKIDVVR